MRCLIRKWSFRFGCMLLAALLLSACAAGRNEFKAAESAWLNEDYDLAAAAYATALEKAPGNNEYRLRLDKARVRAALLHSSRGDSFMKDGDYASAVAEYQTAFNFDGSLFVVAEQLKNAQNHLGAKKYVAEAEQLLQARRRQPAKAAVSKALLLVADFQPALQLKAQIDRDKYTIIDGVELEIISDQPINLNFKEAKLVDVFDILTKLSGINFILDEDVRGSNTSLFLEQATFAQSLELLLRMNKLDKKVLNSKTIILFPKTRDKQKQFEDQIIQTFYLSSIDAKKAVNLLRTMLQVRKIYVHEELNAIIIRDKPQVIRLAQKILEANDRGDAEVVFDLELIEVLHSDGLKFGPKLSVYELSVGVDGRFVPTDDKLIGKVIVDSLNDLDFLYGLPSATFDILKESGEGEILASPKIRVKNKEKAKVHIGSREPVITVTNNGDDSTDSVQYIDVGVKLDVEPIIQLDNTIVTKLGLEVSNVSERNTTSNGTSVLTISTTNATTSLTLKDGERTIIGGLLRDTKTNIKKTIPFLGDIPFLGALFTNYDKENSKSEILLSVTPHIVKQVNLPTEDLSSIWSGGEDDLKFGRNFGSFADDYAAGQQGLTHEVDYQTTGADAAPVSASQPLTPPSASLPTAAPVESTVPVAASAATVPVASSVPAESTSVPGFVSPVVESVDETEPVDKSRELVAEVAVPEPQKPVVVARPKVFVDGPRLVKIGQQFDVAFLVDEIQNLFSAPMYVQYDPARFEFVSAEEGTFLQQGVSPTVFTHTALDGSGRIIVGLKQGAGAKGISGGGDLFSMKFRTVSPGKGEIRVSRTNFRNPGGERQRVDTVGLTVEVSE